MGRRTAAEAEALRQKIVDEALRQFADRGAAATSMKDIADAVGVSKQALMHHFKSKQALEEAIEERVKTSLDRALPTVVAAFTAADAELDGVLTEAMELFDSHYDLSRYIIRRVIFDAQAELPPSGAAMGLLLTGYLRQGQETGALRKDFVPEDTVFALGMLFAATHAASRHRGPTAKDVPLKALRLRRNKEILRIARAALLTPEELLARQAAKG